ncbi:hypothetical protein [Actinoplanes solisilvae]|uniref:hypothetical protein n=1 Tax=Actinoplanes solisilvae TaxID=2486853 RepID=UPI000FDB77AD|nr:hypothetical protein [Actinoplanes solisilvae]
MDASSRDWSRARILRYDQGPPSRDSRLCLLWPAWAYRVTAPVLEQRGLDLFQRVTLALCQADIRQPDRIGELVGLKATLCAHILDRAVADGNLTRRYDLTEKGQQALRTGASVEAAEWQVCYVFVDPFTGELWPRTVDQLREAYVMRTDPGGAELQLGTPGRSDRADARRILPPDRPPQRPTAARVVEAASADRVARRVNQVRDYEREVGLAPAAVPAGLMENGAATVADHFPELSRVAFLSEPEAVFLLGFLQVVGEDGETVDALTAHDPFGLGTSDLFHSLVYRFGRDDGALDEEIKGRISAQLAGVRDRYRQADMELRGVLERRLADEFGPEIRRDRDAFGLMLELDLAMQSPERDEAIERVAHTALRLYEILLRRMLILFPLHPDTLQSFAGAAPLVRRAMLEKAAQGLGFHSVASLYVEVDKRDLRKANGDPSKSFVKAMLPLSVLAAASQNSHPLRAMTATQPDLPVTLRTLNDLRNRAAHAGRDATNPHDTTWCREAAAAAVRGLLLTPETPTERTPV